MNTSGTTVNNNPPSPLDFKCGMKRKVAAKQGRIFLTKRSGRKGKKVIDSPKEVGTRWPRWCTAKGWRGGFRSGPFRSTFCHSVLPIRFSKSEYRLCTRPFPYIGYISPAQASIPHRAHLHRMVHAVHTPSPESCCRWITQYAWIPLLC